MSTLEEQIERYGDLDQRAKALDKELSPLKDSIKIEFRSLGGVKQELVAGLYKATFTVQPRPSVNPDKLVAKLQELGFNDAVDVQLVPNELKVQNLMFTGQLPAEAIADCVESKNVEVLSVKPIKGGKK